MALEAAYLITTRWIRCLQKYQKLRKTKTDVIACTLYILALACLQIHRPVRHCFKGLLTTQVSMPNGWMQNAV